MTSASGSWAANPSRAIVSITLSAGALKGASNAANGTAR